MRITNDGSMVYCRWANKFSGTINIRDVDPGTFFQQHMSSLRSDLLQGKRVDGCKECYQMENHNKVSGRQKQLLKTGVQLEYFDKTMLSSPWYQTWRSGYGTGNTDQLPQDWQIDLGNYCNSACVFCSPVDSSRLAAEWKRIGFIDKIPKANWADDPALVQKLIDVLIRSPNIKYLHFIGGETVITPAFATILQALVDAGLNKTAAVGFTTNLTTWDQRIVELLSQFETVNVGMSIEAIDPVNDYVRWPSTIANVVAVKNQWIDIAKKHNWFIQYRTTPTLLSISKLLSVYRDAWIHNVSVESCNFLQNPKFLRPTVLPREIRLQYVKEIQNWIDQFDSNSESVVNVRNPDTIKRYLLQDLQSYINYLMQEVDESYLLPEAMEFLKKLELSRGNCVIDYLPEYEQLFRSAGY
jgi:sulfatase maturation enzyme AslB (radical SAM superfamily)